jgi:hypothetical protein
LRAIEADFFAYPDYFAFRVGQSRGSLCELDVFPEHKEPVLEDDAEAILWAIDDRGITHLLVPEGATAGPLGPRETFRRLVLDDALEMLEAEPRPRGR